MTDLLSSASQAFSPLIGVAPLMRRAFKNEDLKPLGEALLARAQANPGDANAYLDCSTVLQLIGHRDVAMAMQAQAIEMQPLYSIPSKLDVPGLRLLVLMGPGDLMANTPIEFLVEDSDVSLDLLYLTLNSEWPEIVPDHDVMMVAMAESEANQPLLAQIAALVAQWPRPVINLPEHIAVLSRDGVCAVLQNLPGVDMPVTVRIDRATLELLANGGINPQTLLPNDNFPFIVRPVGSHAGQNLEKLASREDAADYLAKVAADRFYLSRFVDYRSADGLFRKYRIALIEGQPFVCHFAVSSHWMVHYLNAGMNESAEKRAEEAQCMANFENEFALRHAQALKAIYQRMQLPYLGIDCAETLTGDLLIFEVDNAMIVHAMDPVDMYPYKKPAMRKVFNAFRQLLENARNSNADNVTS
ncbi:RimK family alpha-L-glutamate ligase [Undibacterium sp. Jales W-56]|uniref:ATP-grasp domain-containing protein n=1 Tax=Undibacterium sp. Jales W-56 TaxID=2897325 RepID=UPI0021D174D8|nr:RimK family alpha-L-glutamate ligase [Undibacterium sp. Jales W-56]MCU6433595.1 RimK family alpha-L-glutamate ligase [Undibacterium sp. Jales W-56]